MENTARHRNLTTDEWNRRIHRLYAMLGECRLCPRNCGVNRIAGETGYCRAGDSLRTASYGAHFGEEPCLVGEHGSGTIFFSWCGLRCTFCQNYDLALLGEGQNTSEEDCAGMMLSLQDQGCHNINLVTPTHYTPHIVRAVHLARGRGLRLPLVWNSSGYESRDILALLDGIVDIYMPDIKYSSSESARRYSRAPDYFPRCREAVREMHRQVGDLETHDGVATRGLLVRHLVLPENRAGSEGVFSFLAREISPGTYVNILSQYRPCGDCPPEINRRIRKTEYDEAVRMARNAGLTRILEEHPFPT